MRTRVHPLSRAVYDVREDGLLDVTLGVAQRLGFASAGVARVKLEMPN